EKPVSTESFDRALRAARTTMLRERRRYYRLPVQAPVTVARAPGQELLSGVSLNISENGMALRSEVRLFQRALIGLQVRLPEFPGTFRCSAEVVWADSQGRAGTRFLSLKGKAREMLTDWIQRELEQAGPIPQSVSE